MGLILRFWNWLSRFLTSRTVESQRRSSVEWSTTRLRQGSVLKNESVKQLGLMLDNFTGDPVVAIISHSCDLVASPASEPFVEVVLGRPIESPQSGCTHAQSPYRLHIEFLSKGGAQHIEFVAINKRLVAKSDLAGVESDNDFTLSDDNYEVFQRWLAARYRRASFPNALVERLKPMRDKLSGIAKRSAESIIGIWIRYDPKGRELPDGDPYELWISIVYSTRVNGAKEVAEESAEKLAKSFESQFKRDEHWNLLDLRSCKPIPETSFTVLDLLRNDEWRMEHVSLKQSPRGEAL